MTAQSFLREASRRVRFLTDRIRAFEANRRARRSLPPPQRLPAQPWRVASTATSKIVAVLPAGPGLRTATPTAYRAHGKARTEWPFAAGMPGYDLRVRSASGITVLPRRVAFDAHGMLLPLSLEHGNNALVELPLIGGQIFRDSLPADPIRPIEGPVFVADTCWANVYGHLLLEIIPSLLLLSEAPDDAIVLTSAPLSRTLLVMAEALGVPRHRLRRISGPLLCTEVFWPDHLSHANAGVHPLIWTAYERLLSLAAGSQVSQPERIFISRSGITARRLRNEAVIEDLFAQHGFAIVHPEKLPIEDQIALFSRAKLIAGLGGSGMHNAVFARRETPVLIIQTQAMAVSRDISLSHPSRPLGYVFGETDRFEERFVAPWSVDYDDVAVGIAKHFQL